MTSSPPQTASALQEVPTLAQLTATYLRGDFDREQLAQEVESYAARPSRHLPTVVVVGETKRGKSSLVNSLLGRPGLSPVDVEVATLVHIAFSYADTPTAKVSLRGQQEPIDIDVDDLFDWACEQGNPGNAKGVTAIDVGLPVALLRSLTLIDTPGVGGLELGHGELTLQALSSADAVLFVVDAGAPISQTELTFLNRAAEHIDTVVLVLTKIDAYPQWRQIKKENNDLLEAHVPVATAVIPISSVNADRALGLGDGPQGRLERQRSGLDDVERVLSGFVANRAHLLWGANTMRFCLKAVAEMKRLADEQLAVAECDPDKQRELDAEQARLDELTPAEARWRAQLTASITKLKLDRSHELTQRLTELKTKYDQLADKCRSDLELQQLAGQFTAAVDAMTAELARETATKLIDDVMAVIEVIAQDTGLRESLSRISGAADAARPQYEPPKKGWTALDVYTQVMPVVGISRIVSLPVDFVLPGVGTVAGMVVGGAAAIVMQKQRQAIAKKNAFVAWTQKYLADVSSDDNHAFGEKMADALMDLAVALDTGIRRRAQEVESAKSSLSALRNQTEADREAAVRAAQDKLDKIDNLNAWVQNTLTALQDERVADAAAVESPPPT